MSQRFCSNCGNKIPENTRFCNSCGKPVSESVSNPPVQPIPRPEVPSTSASRVPVARKPDKVPKPKNPKVKKSLGQRIRWLFTRDGLPVLITILVGFVIGALVGSLGVILSTALGLFILYRFKRLPFKIKPWQALVAGLSPIVARLLFLMIFLLPVASYLRLPSGHTPDTLTKYVSIVIAIPKNLIDKPVTDVFPGLVIIVLISIGLMLYGSMSLSKPKGWIFALIGLLLYTFSPTITSCLMGNARLRFIPTFFSVGYYFAWLGLILMPLSRFIPRWLKSTPSSKVVLNIIPPVLLFSLLAQDNTIRSVDSSFWLSLFDFESMHHGAAAAFSGAVAAWGSASIVDEIGNDGNEAPPDTEETEEPVDTEETETPVNTEDTSEPPLPSGPQPYSNPPDAPPGSTKEYNPDGSITVHTPDGTVGTKYKDGTEVYHLPDGTTATKYNDGTIYAENPDGSKTTEYPDGTTKAWSPDGSSQIEKPDGSFEVTYPDGTKGSMVKNDDGTMDATSFNGDKMHFPKEGPPVGTMTGKDGTSFTFNKDGTGSVTAGPPLQGTLKFDPDGNMSGTVKDDQGNQITMTPDGGFEGKTKEGDTITVDTNGLKVKMADGTFISTDLDGKVTGAHLKDENGTIDLTTDSKGGTHVKDDKGNTMDVNPDGSGTMGGDVKGTWDTKGNSEFKGNDGSKMSSSSDGSVSVQDGKGNQADLGKDGSLTVKDTKGTSTTFTADQLKQMSGQ